MVFVKLALVLHVFVRLAVIFVRVGLNNVVCLETRARVGGSRRPSSRLRSRVARPPNSAQSLLEILRGIDAPSAWNVLRILPGIDDLLGVPGVPAFSRVKFCTEPTAFSVLAARHEGAVWAKFETVVAFWSHEGAKVANCETVVAFGVMRARTVVREVRDCRFRKRGAANWETVVAFGLVESRNGRLSSLLDWWSHEMRDCRRFWNREEAKLETLVLLNFLNWWVREMRDAGHFGKRGVAKCEIVLAFGLVSLRNARLILLVFGVVRASNGLSWLLEVWRREMQDCCRLRNHEGAKCETCNRECEIVVIFGVMRARNARLSSLLEL